jgi:hypothetical protein|tara:strand:+ start:344 stop:502 length:159 start_codon:yes stop_codon:yes gene_type:complete
MLDKARVHPPLQKGGKKKETITASEQNEMETRKKWLHQCCSFNMDGDTHNGF